MNSPDYSQAAGDLHFPATVLLNRSLPTPGGLLRAQSMPAGVSKIGGLAKQELDPRGRVQELCGAARAGDHSMVRALLQGARSMDRVIDAVNEGELLGVQGIPQLEDIQHCMKPEDEGEGDLLKNGRAWGV